MTSYSSYPTIGLLPILKINHHKIVQIALLLTSLLFSIISFASELPDLGATDLKDYNQQTETALGRAFSTALHQHYDLFYDPITLSYIRRIGSKITSETGQSRHYSFFVVNDANINAFAGPNGVIGINTGLITAAESEDELASVIAHETAHVTQRHLSRSYEYQTSLSTANIAALIAAILVGTQDPGAGMATYMGAMGLSIQQQLKNSRIHESEADYFGIKYLYKAGYNPMAMSDFFGRLEKESQLYEFNSPEILRTHPVTANRLAKAKDRAKQLAAENRPRQNRSLRLIQLRVALLTGQNVNNFKNLKLSTTEKCYLAGLELLSSVDRKLTNEITCLEKSIEKYPEERLLLIQKALLTNLISKEESHKQFHYLEAIYPSDFSIPYLHASALEQHNEIEQAIQILKTQTPKFHYQFLMYSKLAQLYAKQHNNKYVYYYDALANYNIGNTKKALHLIKRAKSLEKNKKSKLYEKLTRFESELAPKGNHKNK